MQVTLISAGVACIIAAIVGGGLEAFGIKLPLLSSMSRKVTLASFGVVLLLVPAFPYLFKLATVSGKVFDITSNQGVSGVLITLTDTNGDILAQDIFTTGQDGGFQFALPREVNKKQLPLRFRLNRIRWGADYVPEEKITNLSSDQQINLPLDLASMSVVTTSVRSTSAPSNEAENHDNHSAAPPAAASNIEEMTLFQNGTTRLLVRGSPGYLDFEIRVRPTDSPSLNFDVNKNHEVDANVDVSYGLLDSGAACAQYRLTISSWTTCGGFHSVATVAIHQGVDAGVPVKIVVWHIPRQEINAESGDARLTISVYNELTKGLSYFPNVDFSQTLSTSSL